MKYRLRNLFSAAVLLASGVVLPVPTQAACDVHNHACNFHGIGRSFSSYIDGDPNFDTTTSVHIVGIGDNNQDFDNNVLLPEDIQTPIISTTGFPVRGDQPYISGAEQLRHVYPSQYQIDFQFSTARAEHSGDLNGLENFPGETGCAHTGSAACEEIRITGNIPDPGDANGFVVKQTNHLYNAQNVPNPSVNVTSFAYATGRASLIEKSHLGPINNPVQGFSASEPQTATLSGTGAKSPEYTYHIRYNDFDPHAFGASTFFDQYYRTTAPAYEQQRGHKIFTVQDTIEKRYNYTVSYGDLDPETGRRQSLLDTSDVTAVHVTPRVIGERFTPEYLQQLAAEQAERERQERIRQMFAQSDQTGVGIGTTTPNPMLLASYNPNADVNLGIYQFQQSSDDIGVDDGEPYNWVREAQAGREIFSQQFIDQYQSVLDDPDSGKLQRANAHFQIFMEENISPVANTIGDFLVIDTLATGEDCARNPNLASCGEIALEIWKPAKVVRNVDEVYDTASFLNKTEFSESFFEGTKYTDKVKVQMKHDDFHGFPEQVKLFEGNGTRTFQVGGDGQSYEILEIPGGYMGREGRFEFMKDQNGLINHRFFKPEQ